MNNIDYRQILEVIGYTGSVLVAVSLTMSNIMLLRWINFIGAVFFVIYAGLIQTWPVLFVNGFIAIIDVYYILIMRRRSVFFSILDVSKNDTIFLTKFLGMYGKDINKFFPEFNYESLRDPHCVFVMRNLNPVGLFVFELNASGDANVKLDYVIKEYRDRKNARFLFVDKKEELIKKGVKNLVVTTHVTAHQEYLKKIGFVEESPIKFKKSL